MKITKIEKKSLPDIDDGVIHRYSWTGEYLGSTEIAARSGGKVSKWTDAVDQLPFRAMTLKRKHRQQ